MNNNDYFQMLLHLHGLGRDVNHLINLIHDGGYTKRISQKNIRSWRAHDASGCYVPLPDEVLAAFIDGLFAFRNKRIEQGFDVWVLNSDAARESHAQHKAKLAQEAQTK